MPSGSSGIFASGPFTFAMYATNPKAWRYTLVWEKTRLSRFLDANRRPLQAHEDILVFCRAPHSATYNPQRTPAPPGATLAVRRNKPKTEMHYGAHETVDYIDDGMRHPGTVLRFASCGNKECPNINPTQKPVPLLRWLVRSYSNAGDVVLDCCAGSGTTAVACLEEGRRYILGEDMPAQYERTSQRLAQWRPEAPATATKQE